MKSVRLVKKIIQITSAFRQNRLYNTNFGQPVMSFAIALSEKMRNMNL